MRCVIGKFQSVSGTPLKWQPYLSTSRACLQRSPPFAFRVTGKRWQGCVRECLHVRVQVYDSYLSCKPSHKKLDSNTQTAAFKAERGHFFLWFFRFLQCTDCVLPGKLGEITSHLGAESPREQLKVSVYTHTHTHVPILHSFPGWNGSPLGIHFSAYYTSEVLQAPARNRSAFLCYTPELSFHLSVCQLQSRTKGKRAVG